VRPESPPLELLPLELLPLEPLPLEPPPLEPPLEPPPLYPEDETDPPPPEDEDPAPDDVLLVPAPDDAVVARGSGSRCRTRVYPTPSIAWPVPLGRGASEPPPSTDGVVFSTMNCCGYE